MRRRGIGLVLVGFFFFSVADALMKHLSGTYPLPQTVFFNALFGLVPILVLAAVRGGARALATRRPLVQALRGLLGLATGYGAFFAFSRMPMADVYAILFSAPILVSALSAVVFGERVGRARWLAILTGFAGVLVMLRPDGVVIDMGALGALGSAVCFALSALLVRHWGRTETAASFPFYGNLLALVLLGPMLPVVHVAPGAGDFALMAATGLSAGVALICVISAFRIAPSPVVAPFQYSQIVWGVLFGVVVFGDRPDAVLLAGAAVVIGSGIFLLRRDA